MPCAAYDDMETLPEQTLSLPALYVPHCSFRTSPHKFKIMRSNQDTLRLKLRKKNVYKMKCGTELVEKEREWMSWRPAFLAAPKQLPIITSILKMRDSQHKLLGIYVVCTVVKMIAQHWPLSTTLVNYL